MKDWRRWSCAVFIASLVVLLAGCDEQEPTPISVTGVPPGGVSGSVIDVSGAGETLRIRVETTSQPRESGTDSSAMDRGEMVNLIVDGLAQAAQAERWEFDWSSVDTLRAGVNYHPSGPATRMELYRKDVLVAVISDNVGARRPVIADAVLEAGEPTRDDLTASSPPAPGRRFVNAILHAPTSSQSVTPLEPHTFEGAGARWRFVLLSATASTEGGDSAPKTSEEAAEPGPLSDEGASFSADWLLFRVE